MLTAFFAKQSRGLLKALVPVTALPLVLLTNCGETELTCGPGTHRSGNQCVTTDEGVGGTDGNGDPDPSGGGGDAGTDSSSGGTGGDTPSETPIGPQFSGISSTAPASDVSVQVTWQAAEDATTPAAQLVYRVYVATSSGKQNFGKPSIVSPPGASSVLVGNLEPDTDYYFVVRAVNADGLEDQNETELVGTPTTDETAPEFDGLARGEPAGAAAVKLSWSAASDDATPPEGISYVVRWATSEAGAAVGSVALQTLPGVTSVVVSGLPAPSTKYFFAVSAQDAAGNSETSSVAKAIKTGDDKTAPHFVGCTGATDPGATTALVSWEPAVDDTTAPEAIAYNVYAFTQPVDADTAFGKPVGSFVGGDRGRVEGLLAGTEYYFVCRAQDLSENEDENLGFRTIETRSDGAPPDFDGIVDVVADSTSVVLSWSEASDPGDQTPANEIVYLVYQSTNPDTLFDEEPAAVSNPGATNIKLTGLTSATQYYWAVRAQDKAQNIDDNTTQLGAETLVSLALDVQPILTKFCVKSGCHSASNPPQGLNMDVGSAFFNLVGVTAIEAPTLKRIQPGDPTLSYMVHKLNGTQATVGGSGQQMPPVGNQTPSPQNVEIITKWIAQGAGNN
jgi:Fibronectin type III domain